MCYFRICLEPKQDINTYKGPYQFLIEEKQGSKEQSPQKQGVTGRKVGKFHQKRFLKCVQFHPNFFISMELDT